MTETSASGDLFPLSIAVSPRSADNAVELDPNKEEWTRSSSQLRLKTKKKSSKTSRKVGDAVPSCKVKILHLHRELKQKKRQTKPLMKGLLMSLQQLQFRQALLIDTPGERKWVQLRNQVQCEKKLQVATREDPDGVDPISEAMTAEKAQHETAKVRAERSRRAWCSFGS